LFAVAPTTIEAIRSKRTRLRSIELPVKYGKFNERKRCPMKKGHVYPLGAKSEYTRWRRMAAEQPTRARGVLWLVDQCERPTRGVTITVTTITRDRDRDLWLISFVVGDQPLVDPPRFPASGSPREAVCQITVGKDDRGRPVLCGCAFGREFPDEPERCHRGHPKPTATESDVDHGYVSSASRAVRDIGEAVPAKEQERQVKQGRQNHELGTVARRQRQLELVAELRNDLRGDNGTASERKHLRSIEHHLRALQDEAMGVRRRARAA
jgi:hypothetical protein